jgi:hypothetical protein
MSNHIYILKKNINLSGQPDQSLLFFLQTQFERISLTKKKKDI